MLENKKAVIFDMDGTLIDSIWVWAQVDFDYLKRLDIDLPEDLRRNIEGLSFPETAIYFKNRFNISDSIDVIMKDWKDMVYDYYHNVIALKKGVTLYLDYLKGRGLKIGIATSNSMDLTVAVLKRNGVLQYFDEIVTTDQVPRDKSFPDVFVETSKRLGVAPSECLVFEDTYCAVLGAKAANMTVVGIYDVNGTSSFKELENICDYTYEGFDKLIYS